MPSLKEVNTAPATIQTAALAVVRLSTAGSTATGSFISPTGLLLTNNHVLGNGVCPAEGCYVSVTLMSQLGQTQQKVVLFAKPVAVDVGLDMAVVQLTYGAGGSNFQSPNYLSFNAQSASSLIGQHVTVVGHPDGYLKKLADGVVAYALGEWIETTVYVLPGDSGSPILDDSGKIVGLIHRGPTSEDLFTSDSANMFSFGSASAPIVTAMATPSMSTMISVTAPTTADNFVANDLVYLNAKTSAVNVNGTQVDALSLLGTACDEALARNDFKSPDDLQSALTPCYHAQTWIECRADASPVSYGVVCPAGSDADTWSNRYQRINQLWLAMNGTIDYYSASFAVARLQPNVSSGQSAGAQALQQTISASAPTLDFTLANYLAAFSITSYDNTDLKSYLLNYQNVIDYQLEGSNVASAAGWLAYNQLLSSSDLQSLQSRLANDLKLSLGTKLYVEYSRYLENAL